jgi:hypothetical protein
VRQASSEIFCFSHAPAPVPKQRLSSSVLSPRAPRDPVPLGWILRAHGVTPAHHFLRTQAKTSGMSSCVSEPPGGVGLAMASQIHSREPNDVRNENKKHDCLPLNILRASHFPSLSLRLCSTGINACLLSERWTVARAGACRKRVGHVPSAPLLKCSVDHKKIATSFFCKSSIAVATKTGFFCAMLSFKSFLFTSLLVNTVQAERFRYSRLLSQESIAGFSPQTSVTDHVSPRLCSVCR